VIADHRIAAQPQMMRGAAPPIVGRIDDQARAHGCEFHMPKARYKEAITFDQRIPVAALPHRARAAMAPVEGPDISAAEGLHHAAQGMGRGGCRQQQHLVVDERVPMQGDLMGSSRIPKRAEVSLAIGVVECERLPEVGSMNDQVRMPGDAETRQPGHADDSRLDSGPINAGRQMAGGP